MVKTQKKTQKKIRYRGVAILEAALVFPLLLLLTFGAIEYGWLFLKAQQITNAARQGARVGIRPDATNTDVLDTISVLMTKAEMADKGYRVDFPLGDVSSFSVGEALEVQVTVPCANIAIINIPLLPLPENLGASVTMSKEGP